MMGKYNFVNPYNFVPLSKKRSEWDEDAECKYSGVIEYRIRIVTPLFIPNTSNSDAFKMNVEGHKSYDFFSYTDLSGQKDTCANNPQQPVIPGSEMRGMLRANYEILTNSCMSAIDGDEILGKRTLETFKSGLLKKEAETYVLYEATDCLMRTGGENSLKDDWANDKSHYLRKCYVQKDIKEGQKVYFRVIRRDQRNQVKPLAQQVSLEPKANMREGYMIKGEDGPPLNDPKKQKQQKHCAHIFLLNPQKRVGEVKAEVLDAAVKAYKDNEMPPHHPYEEYTREWKKFKDGKGEDYFPVYYSSVDSKYVMLSPACITREIYKNKLGELIGSYASCDGGEKLCPACALFGMVGAKYSRGSRIRVGDLVCMDERPVADLYERPITLPELSSPKINNMEFYLKRPADNAVFWTYDYYVGKDQRVIPKEAEINGRKFYWHDLKTWNRLKGERQEPIERNMTVRPLKKGVMFSGKLYFDKISKKELDQLIYLLKAGDEKTLEEKKHGYKLGGAKPYGFGSISIDVDRVLLRVVKKDVENHTVSILPDVLYDSYETPFDEESVKDFRDMTDFYILNDKVVSYPLREDPAKKKDQHIYEWFVENHKKTGKIRMRRDEMVFKEYMKAMEPYLKQTGVEQSQENRQKNRQKYGQNSRR